MAMKISTVTVYACDMFNQPGRLSRALEALRNAGANLEFVIGRRVTERTSRVFVAPLKGARQIRAAADVEFRPAKGMHVVRIEAPDAPGLGATLTRAVADANINIRGISAAAFKKLSVCYMAFATEAEAKAATRVLKALGRKRRR
ncbi:MAG: ACT domain-containing protein [Phycisphaerales bacterium]|nr:ACT domain-containing protein [Phycisphaerales bacterium]